MHVSIHTLAALPLPYSYHHLSLTMSFSMVYYNGARCRQTYSIFSYLYLYPTYGKLNIQPQNYHSYNYIVTAK